MDESRRFLRHALATLAYRAEKPLRTAPKGFASVRAGKTTRSAGEILGHLCDLLDWAYSTASDKPKLRNSKVESWEDGVKRFYAAVKKLDRYLASDEPMAAAPEKLFQGPIADSLTHVGQLATLRRLAGSPVRGEDYFSAQIVIGRVGRKQSARRVEFG
jgi:hypothetical protein